MLTLVADRAAKLPLFVSGADERKFWWLVNLKGNFGHTAFFRKWEQYKYLSWKNNSFHCFKGNKWNVVWLEEFPEIINFLWKYIQSNKCRERKYLEIFQRSLISFGNTSYQTNERKYSEDFQSKLTISVNSDNQTSFQLFYWNEIREWKFYWKW